ncbi:hypothetical protein MMC17_004231 [Xylographa soralifera]|nr:hypothetical protein [Xylographa soralifera]
MDPASHEEADDHGHKSHKTSSGLVSLDTYLATIPDNFDVSGDDLITADSRNTTVTDQNSKVLQAFDNEYGINQVTNGGQIAESSSSNHQGVLSHVSDNRIAQNVLTQKDPTSPTAVSQLITADVPRHQSEPVNQEGPNNPKQHAASNTHVPTTIARSLSTSGVRPATPTQLIAQSTLQETVSNLTTLPLKKHLNRPLTSSPLARQMTIIAEAIQTPTTSTNFTNSTTAIARGNLVTEPLLTSEDRRYKLANSSPFLGFSFDGTEQAANSVTKYDSENTSYLTGTFPDTQFGQTNVFQEHTIGRNPFASVGPFGIHTHLRHGLSYGNSTLFNQPGENWNVELNTPNHEAQLEQMRSGQALAQNAQGPFMRSEERLPYSTMPLAYPEYFGEPNHYDQSGNFHFDPAQTSQQLVLKSERATENLGTSVNYGQLSQHNPYVETTPTPSLEFENNFIQANNVPYYLPGGSRGSPAPKLKFSRLYEFENQRDTSNDDHSWRSDSTYPHYPRQEQLYVKKIIKAMSDMDSANDNPGMLEMWSKLKKNGELLEKTAWKLLQSCNKSHKHIASLAHAPRIPQRPRIYADHISELCKALREEKTICKHLLSADYAESFVDDPANAAHRVHNNRKVNGGKKVAIEKGRAAMSLVKDARDSDEVDLEAPMMKNEYDQSMEGYIRQASQQLINNGTAEGSILEYRSPANQRMFDPQQEATATSTTPGPQEGSTKKSTKKSSARKKAALKSPTRKSTRKPKANFKDEDEDSDDDDDSYEPTKTPKRKRANRNTKYPTTQLADGSYVIKTITSPPATPLSRRKRQTTLDASAPNENMAAFGQTLSSFGQANQPARNIAFTPRQDTLGNHAGDTTNSPDQLDGTEPYPFMFGYQNQNPAHQLQSQGTRGVDPFTAPSAIYQHILHESTARRGPSYGQGFIDPGLTGPNFLNPLNHLDNWTPPFSAGTIGTTSQYETAGPLQAEPGHGIQDEGENYHLSLGRRRFRPFTEEPMEDDSDAEGN